MPPRGRAQLRRIPMRRRSGSILATLPDRTQKLDLRSVTAPAMLYSFRRNIVMHETLCIRLPLLRGPLPGPENKAGPAWPGALRLWPGLPDCPDTGWHCPEDYPFTPREAAACLADLRQLSQTALSALPVGAAAPGNARAARQAVEMALLKNLHGLSPDEAQKAKRAEAARRTRLEREQAQKALLWFWLQEEYLAELAELTRRCAEKAENLTTALCPEEDDAVRPLPGSAAGLPLDQGLAPPWRAAAANAAYFLPDNVALAVEGPMRASLLELLEFTPAPHWAEFLGCSLDAAGESGSILEARAPLWRVLGRAPSVSENDPWAAERVWLTWRERA